MGRQLFRQMNIDFPIRVVRVCPLANAIVSMCLLEGALSVVLL